MNCRVPVGRGVGVWEELLLPPQALSRMEKEASRGTPTTAERLCILLSSCSESESKLCCQSYVGGSVSIYGQEKKTIYAEYHSGNVIRSRNTIREPLTNCFTAAPMADFPKNKARWRRHILRSVETAQCRNSGNLPRTGSRPAKRPLLRIALRRRCGLTRDRLLASGIRKRRQLVDVFRVVLNDNYRLQGIDDRFKALH